MRIPIDRRQSQPLYQQIETYLREQILSGTLAPDTRLPATRQLADALGVSRITVKNAYDELESKGLVESRVGDGTYVIESFFSNMPLDNNNVTWPLWQEVFAEDTAQKSTPIASLRLRVHPSPIDFTGVGDPQRFPIQDFQRAMKAVTQRDGVEAWTYDAFDGGYLPLRETVAHILGSQGIKAHAENVLITAGSQQALSFVCQTLLKEGDVVVVEEPTYNLALDLLKTMNMRIVGVPVDAQGMMVETLEPILQKYHPKLIYTIPNFQNPNGSCMNTSRRRQLLSLAERYNVPILEDDFVGDLRYDGRAQPSIKALDPGGRVIYIGTFSKMLMPGLRLGFLVAEGPVFEHFVQLKRVHDLTSSTFIQRALHEYVTVGRYQAYLRRTTRAYRQRRDVMLTEIKQHLPGGTQVSKPSGGLFMWVRLPEGISSQALLPYAAHAGVIYAPGTRFYANPQDGDGYIRLNFATQPSDAITEGIQRLGMAIRNLRNA